MTEQEQLLEDIRKTIDEICTSAMDESNIIGALTEIANTAKECRQFYQEANDYVPPVTSEPKRYVMIEEQTYHNLQAIFTDDVDDLEGETRPSSPRPFYADPDD